MALCHDTVRQLAGAQTRSKCLRLLKRDRGVSLSFEIPRNEDMIVHHNGLSVIAVSEEVAEDLAGKTLDLADDGSFVIT
jgi:hypothetical protein